MPDISFDFCKLYSRFIASRVSSTVNIQLVLGSYNLIMCICLPWYNVYIYHAFTIEAQACVHAGSLLQQLPFSFWLISQLCTFVVIIRITELMLTELTLTIVSLQSTFHTPLPLALLTTTGSAHISGLLPGTITNHSRNHNN